MSNVETAPAELVCGGDVPRAEVVEPRAVPLGGPRAMTVRRTLPRRARSLVGAWCFVDHYGPDRVADTGAVTVDGVSAAAGRLVCLPPGVTTLELGCDDAGARVLLLGGEPLGERLVMWWNFVGGSHDEIADARARWQHERTHPDDADRRFGVLPEAWVSTLPAPELPNARLRPRG